MFTGENNQKSKEFYFCHDLICDRLRTILWRDNFDFWYYIKRDTNLYHGSMRNNSSSSILWENKRQSLLGSLIALWCLLFLPWLHVLLSYPRFTSFCFRFRSKALSALVWLLLSFIWHYITTMEFIVWSRCRTSRNDLLQISWKQKNPHTRQHLCPHSLWLFLSFIEFSFLGNEELLIE